MEYKKIVLHIPHSSYDFPEGMKDMNKWEDVEKISLEMIRWTDNYTDVLFRDKDNSKVIPVIFQHTRFYCDVERLIDDPLEEKGQGIIYTEFEGVKRNVTDEERKKIMELYHKHHDFLKEKIEENTLLIDCHSFPVDLSKTDICLGWNEDKTKPDEETINMIKNHFEDNGYKVSFNEPFSNSIAPDKDVNYHSIMIEVNKHTYTNRFDQNRLNQTLKYLYKKILKK